MSNEVDAAMPVSSKGLRTTDEAGIGQRFWRTADKDETLARNLFPGRFLHGIFSYWPELLGILVVKFLLCYFGILTGLKRDIERCSYFTRDLCPKFNPISASAEFFLYFNRAFRPKLFYSNGSLHSTIPLLAGNGIDDLSILLGPDWAFSLLQDLNFLKEAIDTHSSLHQASKECSCQAYIACLLDASYCEYVAFDKQFEIP